MLLAYSVNSELLGGGTSLRSRSVPAPYILAPARTTRINVREPHIVGSHTFDLLLLAGRLLAGRLIRRWLLRTTLSSRRTLVLGLNTERGQRLLV